MQAHGTFSFPEKGVLHAWPHGFLLTAPTFRVDRGTCPTRRPSIRIMLSELSPFEVEFSDGSRISTKAVLMSEKTRRRRIIASNSNFVLFDFAASTPEYAALHPLIANQQIVHLENRRLRRLLSGIARTASGELSGEELKQLRHGLVLAISGTRPEEPPLDARVTAALELIHTLRLEDISLPLMAASLHLSPERLRHLFKKQIGHPVSHYARAAAIRKALVVWSKNQTLTDLAQQVGFHDASHFNHAFREMLGFPPMIITDAGSLRMISHVN